MTKNPSPRDWTYQVGGKDLIKEKLSKVLVRPDGKYIHVETYILGDDFKHHLNSTEVFENFPLQAYKDKLKKQIEELDTEYIEEWDEPSGIRKSDVLHLLDEGEG